MSNEDRTPSPPPPKPRGRLGSAVLPVSGVIVLAFVAHWIFGLLPGHGAGNGNNPPPRDSADSSQVAPPPVTQPLAKPPQSQPAAIADAKIPLQVSIHGHDYQVNGQTVTMGQILVTVHGHENATPAVRILVGPDSRVGAQKDLEESLRAAGVNSATISSAETPP